MIEIIDTYDHIPKITMQRLLAERNTLADHLLKMQVTNGSLTDEIDRLKVELQSNGLDILKMRTNRDMMIDLCRERLKDRDLWKSKCEETQELSEWRLKSEQKYAWELLALKSKAEALAEALRKISDKQNWGYFDDSGCPKGTGEYTESWQGDVHAIEIAKAALAEFEEKDGPKKTNNLTYEDTV